MKKIFIIIISLSAILSLFGCSGLEEANSETIDSQPLSDMVNSESITDTETLFETYISVEAKGYTFDTLEEYNELMLQESPHASFVFFEDISYIGELSSGEGVVKSGNEYKKLNCPYMMTYELKDKHCSITVSRYDEFAVATLEKTTEIDIENDSLIYHDMPKNEGGYYDAYEYRMDFEHDSVEYCVSYLYSRVDSNLAAISIIRKVDSYYLRFHIAFNENNVNHNTAHPFAYDMSNEEINKFLSKETAKEAIVKLYTSHLEAVESRSGN